MSNLFERIEKAPSITKIQPVYLGKIVAFSNGSENWSITTVRILADNLKIILENLDDFKKAGAIYDEDEWRKAFRKIFYKKKDLSANIAGSLTGFSSRAYFDLLAKIIHYTSSDEPYIDREISLEKDKIEAAIAELERIADADQENATANHDIADAGQNAETVEAVKGGVNRIFYGAPGTGKSHTVNELTREHVTVRTVFHPDIQNSDFVGALKPVMDGEKITYRFSPGPFAVALAEAVKAPGKLVSLIIEELNRAPAAAVFGELFLLLDRDENGAGKYDSDFPNEEFKKWFCEETGTQVSKLKLPSNFSIYATMNSADQGVYPLDTAFRRRWRQDYIKIDYAKAPPGNVLVTTSESNPKPIEWKAFVKILNDHLTSLDHIQEDRLVGPWFLMDWEIRDEKRLPGKLLIYLWDDLLRHDGRDIVFNTGKHKTYGDLSAALLADEIIFSESFLEKLKDESPVEEADENGEA